MRIRRIRFTSFVVSPPSPLYGLN